MSKLDVLERSATNNIKLSGLLNDLLKSKYNFNFKLNGCYRSFSGLIKDINEYKLDFDIISWSINLEECIFELTLNDNIILVIYF